MRPCEGWRLHATYGNASVTVSDRNLSLMDTPTALQENKSKITAK
jgi:hypothetical protein